MKWASTIATSTRLEDAADEAIESLSLALAGARPDIILAFASDEYADHMARLPERLAAGAPGAILLGCSARGVIGGGREIEREPGLSLTGAVLPGVDVTPFYVGHSAAGLPGPLSRDDTPSLIVLPDPFTIDAEALIGRLDQACPGGTIVGGLASGGTQPGSNSLFLGDEIYRSGAVGLALDGNIRVDTVVAQACRPIGQPMFVTRSSRRTIYELDGTPVMDALAALYSELSEPERELFRHSLHIGLAMRDRSESYGHGDFVVRNLVGIDPEREALVVGGDLEECRVVQFHLRDARSSADDLELMLAPCRESSPAGALLFSCLRRGVDLYGIPNHDSKTFRQHVGEVALGGFFCNGEIGPVEGRTYLHGYTSSFALFHARC